MNLALWHILLVKEQNFSKCCFGGNWKIFVKQSIAAYICRLENLVPNSLVIHLPIKTRLTNSSKNTLEIQYISLVLLVIYTVRFLVPTSLTTKLLTRY